MQSSGGYNGWRHVSDYRTVNSSYGFTMKGIPSSSANPNTIDFRGRPNTGDLLIDCNFDGTDSDPNSGFDDQSVITLTGNPYPSTMDLKKFLIDSDNDGLDGQVYFWEQKDTGSHNLAAYEGGYATYIPGSSSMTDDGSYLTAVFSTYNGLGGDLGTDSGNSYMYDASKHFRRYAAIGQGFVVRSKGIGMTGGIIKNDMRLYVKNIVGSSSTDVFARTNQESTNDNDDKVIAMSHNGIDYQNIINNPLIIPEIKIHTKLNDSYYRENLIAFRQSTDLSYKKFTDGRLPSVLATDTYFIADDIKLGIKSIEYDIDIKLPFGLNAENETNTYSVTIHKMNDVSESVEVYIHDKELDTYNDIKNGSFDISLPQGDYNDRFEIVFKDASQQIIEEIIETEAEVTGSFDVFQNNAANQFVIKNPQSHIIKLFVMYDISGKIIYNKQNLGNEIEYNFPTNNLSSGTYITKITTDQNFEITKKVIVNN
jgi:hypothetical protein